MPITRHAAGARPNRGPDYKLALEPVRRLGLDPRDPLLSLATTVVRRTGTEQSARQYGWIIARLLTWFDEQGIDVLGAGRDDALFWWNTTAGLSPSSRQQQLGVLRGLYREAVERDLITKDPTRVIRTVPWEPLTETPALTLDQVRRLLESLHAEVDHPDRGIVASRDLAIVALMLRLCLREGEVASMRWSMFGETSGERTVSFIGKWHKVAKLNVPDDVWGVLCVWKAIFEQETGIAMTPRDPLFTGLTPAHLRRAEERRSGEALSPLGRPALYTIVSERLRDIGIEGARFGPHCLRTTGATLAYEGGADLIECQTLLRHDSIETTRRFYIKRIDAKATGGMEKMPVRISAKPEAGTSSEAAT